MNKMFARQAETNKKVARPEETNKMFAIPEEINIIDTLENIANLIGLKRNRNGTVRVEPQYVIICMWLANTTTGLFICTLATLVFVMKTDK